MNVTPLLALAFLFISGVVYVKHFYHPKKKKEPNKEPSTGDMVIKEYSYLLDGIANASTKADLAYWEFKADQFEEWHRSHYWTHEMYIDLLQAIQEQFNLLSAKNLVRTV